MLQRRSFLVGGIEEAALAAPSDAASAVRIVGVRPRAALARACLERTRRVRWRGRGSGRRRGCGSSRGNWRGGCRGCGRATATGQWRRRRSTGTGWKHQRRGRAAGEWAQGGCNGRRALTHMAAWWQNEVGTSGGDDNHGDKQQDRCRQAPDSPERDIRPAIRGHSARLPRSLARMGWGRACVLHRRSPSHGRARRRTTAGTPRRPVQSGAPLCTWRNRPSRGGPAAKTVSH
jgi:hypothetical protein